MRVRDYLEILKDHPDRVGLVGRMSSIGAKGTAIVCAVEDYDWNKVVSSPYPIQWKCLEAATASKEYTKNVIEFGEKFVKDLNEADIKKGVKSLLSAKTFSIPIEFGSHTYGLSIKPNREKKLADIRDAISKTTDENQLELFNRATKSDDLMKVIGAVSTLDSSPILLDKFLEVISELDFMDFLKISEVLTSLNTKVYNMDWKSMLKN